jgi:hypothetical protein
VDLPEAQQNFPLNGFLVERFSDHDIPPYNYDKHNR